MKVSVEISEVFECENKIILGKRIIKGLDYLKQAVWNKHFYDFVI